MRIVVAGATGTVGRFVVSAAELHGHQVVRVSRTTGQDLVIGTGLDDALSGADAVIDVSSIGTTSAAASVRFFGAATRSLLAAEERQSVGHHLALSIVGMDTIPFNYYAGKVEQERLIAAGSVPYSILRATQFHEFAGQILARTKVGPVSLMPRGLIRPVSAADVADALINAAEAGPGGRLRDLRGPRDEELVDLARRTVRARGLRRVVIPLSLPGKYWSGMRNGVLRGTAEAIEAPTTFEEWLRG
jgi:uncharacterized protein YbjT (DUF2867 family)